MLSSGLLKSVWAELLIIPEYFDDGDGVTPSGFADAADGDVISDVIEYSEIFEFVSRDWPTQLLPTALVVFPSKVQKSRQLCAQHSSYKVQI